MIPTTLIVTATFTFLLNPNVTKEVHYLNKEHELKSLITRNFYLNTNISEETTENNFLELKKINPKPVRTFLELPAERFFETPLEIEEWMLTPHARNNKDN